MGASGLALCKQHTCLHAQMHALTRARTSATAHSAAKSPRQSQCFKSQRPPVTGFSITAVDHLQRCWLRPSARRHTRPGLHPGAGRAWPGPLPRSARTQQQRRQHVCTDCAWPHRRHESVRTRSRATRSCQQRAGLPGDTGPACAHSGLTCVQRACGRCCRQRAGRRMHWAREPLASIPYGMPCGTPCASQCTPCEKACGARRGSTVACWVQEGGKGRWVAEAPPAPVTNSTFSAAYCTPANWGVRAHFVAAPVLPDARGSFQQVKANGTRAHER